MTQVLQHDYGKSRVSLLKIRAAIKAVKATKAARGSSGAKAKAGKKSTATRSRKGE